jgi:hypothetical protein
MNSNCDHIRVAATYLPYDTDDSLPELLATRHYFNTGRSYQLAMTQDDLLSAPIPILHDTRHLQAFDVFFQRLLGDLRLSTVHIPGFILATLLYSAWF